MYHYTYKLLFSNGMFYIGARSCKCKPEHDILYLGSGSQLPPNRTVNDCKKEITGVFATRALALEAEAAQILSVMAHNNELYYNQRTRVHDKYGTTKDTCAGVASMAEKLKGRTAENSEYIRNANIKRSSYRGTNRTPAQIAGQIRAAETVRGTKNPSKGHLGTSNCAFVPWYYVTPEGIRHEVYDKTKQEAAKDLGFTVRELTHRFHRTNAHKAGTRGKSKGWIFGNLETEEG